MCGWRTMTICDLYFWSAKYRRHTRHYRHLAKPLARAITDFAAYQPLDKLAYVPTSHEHIKQRGIDHASVLAHATARALGIEALDVLIPSRHFVQAGSDRAHRHNNPHYIANANITGLSFVLIDDIATTRTSLFRSANALRRAGAREVIAATCAYRR